MEKNEAEVVNAQFTEIYRLAKMLEESGIPFEFFEQHEFPFGYQIGYLDNERKKLICSVVESKVSYGHKANLLEIMGLLTPEELILDYVKGWLTAEEVFKRIKNDWSKRSEENVKI